MLVLLIVNNSSLSSFSKVFRLPSSGQSLIFSFISSFKDAKYFKFCEESSGLFFIVKSFNLLRVLRKYKLRKLLLEHLSVVRFWQSLKFKLVNCLVCHLIAKLISCQPDKPIHYL